MSCSFIASLQPSRKIGVVTSENFFKLGLGNDLHETENATTRK